MGITSAGKTKAEAKPLGFASAESVRSD